MASWQARTTSFVLRHWFKPRLARTPDALAARKVMSGGPVMPAPRGAQAVPGTVGGIAGEWMTADGGADRRDAALPARRRLLCLHTADLSRRHIFVRARGIQDFCSGLSAGTRTPVPGRARRRHRRLSRPAGESCCPASRGRGRLCGRRPQRGADAVAARTWHSVARRCRVVLAIRRSRCDWRICAHQQRPLRDVHAANRSAARRSTTWGRAIAARRSPRRCMRNCTGCRRC